MTANRLKIAALSFAAALATTTLTFTATTSPAFAAEPTQTVTAVAHRDINLAAPSGERKLRARVKRAAEAMCVNPSEVSPKVQMLGRACIVGAIESAEPQVRAAIERQRAERYAARDPR